MTEEKQGAGLGIPVSVHIRSVQYDLERELMFREDGREDFAREFPTLAQRETREQDNTIEIVTQGVLRQEDGRMTVVYDESELTGMPGATTTVSFSVKEPDIVTMVRYGTVSTTLVFEEKKRYLSVYETGIFPLEVCTYTKKVENTLTREENEAGGKILLDYLVEIRGATAEHTLFECDITPREAEL